MSKDRLRFIICPSEFQSGGDFVMGACPALFCAPFGSYISGEFKSIFDQPSATVIFSQTDGTILKLIAGFCDHGPVYPFAPNHRSLQRILFVAHRDDCKYCGRVRLKNVLDKRSEQRTEKLRRQRFYAMVDKVKKTDDILRDALVEAIQQGCLHERCGALLSDSTLSLTATQKALLRTGAETCETIAAQTETKRDNVLLLLQQAGVAVHNAADAVPHALQYQVFEVRIAPDTLGVALEALGKAGFEVDPFLIERAATVAGTMGALDLLAWDEVSFRLRLAWCDLSKVQRKLAPSPVDIAFVELPKALKHAYLLVPPIRVIWEKISGQKTVDRLGLKIGHQSLGTPKPLIEALLAFTGLTEGDTLLDLGCGDGRIIHSGVKSYGCKGIGVERHEALVAEAASIAEAQNIAHRTEFIAGDIASAPIDKANVIFLFLPPRILKRVLEEVVKAAKPGTRIVVHEQQDLKIQSASHVMTPVFSKNALTVAHVLVV